MAHILEQVINNADGFVLIGDSTQERFPALSYSAYVKAGKRFFCLDMGGRTTSRGPIKDGKVYVSVDELPDDRGDLAVIWVKPNQAAAAVDLAREAGCTRVWFSFLTASAAAVSRATELGMEVVEVGRCPVYYLDDKPLPCRMHTMVVSMTGTRSRPPETEADHGKRVRG